MGLAEEKYGCRSYVSVLEEGLTYIEKRMTGEIKSLKTPWPGFNQAGVGGLEWGSMLTIGARPGAGKTMIASQIIREAHRLNPDQKFNIVEFQFEMGAKQYAARQFAAEVAEDYGVILSTEKALDNFIYERAKQYIQETKFLFSKGIHRDMFPISLNHKEIEDAIKIKYVDGGRKPMIVTIDHSWLIKRTSSEKDKFVFMHLLKVRNGDEQKSIVFLKMDGKNQRMVEVPEFTATRPDGTYLRYSQRTGGGGTRNISAPIGSELD